jgi:hypothetical protein
MASNFVDRLLPKKRDSQDEFGWVNGQDPNMKHLGSVGSGGYGEVFKVILARP